MAKNEKNKIDKTNEIVGKAVDKFSNGIETTQNGILRRINGVLRNLSITRGSIDIGRDNLRILRTLKDDIRSLIFTKQYQNKVDSYLINFNRLRSVNDSYFSRLLQVFNPKKQVFTTVFNSSIELTRNSLGRTAIDQVVIDPALRILEQGITTGMFIDDMEDALRVEIIGDPEGRITGQKRQGNLLRYTKQITRDSLNQFSRNHVESVSKEYDLEWYYYDGSVIDDTRSYCKQRVGKYFHKKEVEKSASERWPGKIKGTNRSTIFTYAGGYQCRHEWLPVLIDVVPNRVIVRNTRNGNYTPN